MDSIRIPQYRPPRYYAYTNWKSAIHVSSPLSSRIALLCSVPESRLRGGPKRHLVLLELTHYCGAYISIRLAVVGDSSKTRLNLDHYYWPSERGLRKKKKKGKKGKIGRSVRGQQRHIGHHLLDVSI